MFQVPVKPPAVTAGDLQFAGLAGTGRATPWTRYSRAYAASMKAALYRTHGTGS